MASLVYWSWIGFCVWLFNFFLFTFNFRMSSLEEPLSFDKLPSMSTIDRIQRFSSSACRSQGEDMGMGARWIEGSRCSTSNSCRYCIKDSLPSSRQFFEYSLLTSVLLLNSIQWGCRRLYGRGFSVGKK